MGNGAPERILIIVVQRVKLVDTTYNFFCLLTRSLGARLNGLQIQGGE